MIARRIVYMGLVSAGIFASGGLQGQTIFDMDDVRLKPGEYAKPDKQKAPVGTIAPADGKFGKAYKLSFVEGAKGFMTGSVRATPEWDAAAGFSFWVKGDGSSNWGGIELIDRSDFALRYAVCFPIDSTEWRQIFVPWKDVIPELASPLVDAKNGYAPSHFGSLSFGKWWYWSVYPAHSYVIDQVQLEKEIQIDKTDYTPVASGTPRLLAKLKEKKPVMIVTMGDSLSDKRHWANKDKLWSEVLSKMIQDKDGSTVKLVNPAIGGTTLSQNCVLLPRWLKDAPAPDLVTICFGFNDWDTQVRGTQFKEYLRWAVDKIRRETQGKTEILLLTTCPAFGRWHTMDEMADAVRSVAVEKKTGLADVAAAFHKAGDAEAAKAQGFWARDDVHLGSKGHDVIAGTVYEAIHTQGLSPISTAKDQPAPSPTVK